LKKISFVRILLAKKPTKERNPFVNPSFILMDNSSSIKEYV